jgi:hypothetical protein
MAFHIRDPEADLPVRQQIRARWLAASASWLMILFP